MSTERIPIERWSVDFGDGRRPKDVCVPHAWKQDLPVDEEGPVVYRTRLRVPATDAWLLFHGVSCLAEILIEGAPVARHVGIWDAFSVSLAEHRGREVDLEVRVVKNGGPSFPVPNVASGFLPYLHHTFGGIFRDVQLVTGRDPLADLPAAPPSRIEVDGSRLYLDGEPFYIRGLLHWGWYPELGHPTPDDETIREEVRQAKALGFNLVKFCLWVPPHRYFEILREEGLTAWLELPLWQPSGDPEHLEAMAVELERIVRQYRRHDAIAVWTVGCELHGTTPPEYRRHLYGLVANLTGSPLVKDNSGGAEMYGGDLREFGDFYDFHPYCDTPFYPQVLDSLLPGPRAEAPLLLGEFNDIDCHRDLALTWDERPYWVSALPELNAQGLRWQYDLPRVMDSNRFVHEPVANGHEALMRASERKALFVRKTVQEWVRARGEIGGYAITGWRDTPISSAGFFDDWGRPRWSPEACLSWNGETVLFAVPFRRPPWLVGGNRPGFLDPFHHFAGPVCFQIGAHSERGFEGGVLWRIRNAEGRIFAQGAESRVDLEPLRSMLVGQIYWANAEPGDYELEVEFGAARNAWPFLVTEQPQWGDLEGWSLADRSGLFEGVGLPGGDRLVASACDEDSLVRILQSGGVALLETAGTQQMPFWRESAYEFNDGDFWGSVPFAEQWSRLLPVSPDRVIDAEWLEARLPEGAKVEVLMNRIDTRTYREDPVIVRVRGAATALITTLRPHGGLGVQPVGVRRSPAGSLLLSSLMRAADL
jgi:hypothetical protein